ncbi:uncharacterized protein LOC108194596 [Daucus carota subsp. sativus]|uniref:uncharacterized protein LOC108194596 n=1 Tax=Daucus carota subsp. sativus TaxID=79200 RepID=UPI0030835C28
MEKIFRVLNCSEEEKARFGVYRLEGDVAQFDQRYFPACVREEYAREYQNIAQKEDESVTDFQIRFQRLANYARSIAGNDADKIMKFKWALKDSVCNHIISNRYATMDSLVDSARDQELHQMDCAKRLEVQDQKRKRDDDPPRFQNNGESSGGFKQNNQRYNTRSFQQKNGNQQNRSGNQSGNQSGGQTGQNGGNSACSHCGKMHSGVCHWISRACLNCGQGHTIRDCNAPLQKSGDQNNTNKKDEQKSSGRVFSLTANDAANLSGL